MMSCNPHSGAPDPSGQPRTTDSPEVVDALHDALDQCPEPGGRPDPNPWHALWHDRLRDRALPALITDGTITPAASLWTGSRLWLQAFRNTSLETGDRIVIALPPTPAFVQVLVAALWRGLTIALLPPDADADAAVEALDARGVVASEPHRHGWVPEGCAGPRSTPDALRPSTTPPTPDVRFALRTSGTTGHARWIALSDRNVLSVLASHLPHFRLNDGRLLSVLPWSHAFGLVLDLMPALLAGAEIIRDPEGGRSPKSILSLCHAWGATHLNAVPLTVQRLLACDGGSEFLGRLRGGIVGGAPISAPLARALSDTQLRVGYGQTEAAPGIALGERGEWAPNYLGRPVGCTVDVTRDGELRFQGPNACLGVWRDGSLDRADPDRWVRTGDLVQKEGTDLYFRGRTDDTLKLSNARLVRAGTWEARLKQEFDVLQDALVHTCDGTGLSVALRLGDDVDPSAAPSEARVREVLSPLAHWIDRVVVVEPSNWKTLPKGTVDRAAMAQRLEATRSSTDSSTLPVRTA